MNDGKWEQWAKAQAESLRYTPPELVQARAESILRSMARMLDRFEAITEHKQ